MWIGNAFLLVLNLPLIGLWVKMISVPYHLLFPPILVYMTASGESSGRLEPMLERAADYLEREFATFTAVMLSLLEPAVIVVMGGVVALIVLSILLPILQINTLAMG